MHASRCTHIKSNLKKRRPLWPVMMDDNAPTHKRRKLVKTDKNVLPQKKRIVVAGVRWETYRKNDEKMEYRKTATNVKFNPTN